MSKTEKLLYGLVSTVAFIYVFARAILNPLVNDEAYSFLYFIYSGKFLPFDTIFWSANNHTVNSLLTWLTYHLFGMEEWVLRLPNLLIFILFTVYIYRFGSLLKSVWLRWSFWICILATPYLLELFSYSRGYGLSIAFLTAGIWHFMTATKRGTAHRDVASWCFMILALFANLNLLNSYFIWLVLIVYFSIKITPYKQLLLHLSPRIAILTIPIAMGVQLKHYNQLYFGFKTSIFDTFTSLITALFGNQSISWTYILSVLLILISFLLLLMIFFTPTKGNAGFIIGSFLVLNVLASLSQFWLLDVNLPQQRTAIHWYFLFIGSLFFVLNQMPKALFKVSNIIAVFLLALPLGQAKRYDLFSASTYDWRIQQFSDSFYNQLVKFSPADSKPVTIESNVLFNKHVYDYLNMKNGVKLNDLQYGWDITNTQADFVLISDSLWQYPAAKYDTLAIDPRNGTTLLKKQKPAIRKYVFHKLLPNPETITDQRYPLAHLNLDSLSGSSLLFEFTLNITAPSPPHLLYNTIELIDSSGNIIATEQIEMTPLKSDWAVDRNTKFTFTWYNIPPTATLAEVYIWNYRKPQIAVHRAECTIFKIE